MEKERILLAKPTEQLGLSSRKLLHIIRVRPLSEVSYQLRVYLHPPSVDIFKTDSPGKQPYLVKTVTIWMSQGHHPDASDVYVDITKAVANNKGADWTISVQADAVPLAETRVQAESMKSGLDTKVGSPRSLFDSLQIEER